MRLPQGFGLDEWNWLRKPPKGTENVSLLAVYDDDVPKLRELVAAGNPNMNYRIPVFGSALELAVRCDDMAAVDILPEVEPEPWAASGFSRPET